MSEMCELGKLIAESKRVCVFTGAGVSTFCGIPDFRSSTGFYSKLPQNVFDIDCLKRTPEVFYKHGASLVYGCDDTKPGCVHEAVKKLEILGKCDGVITQNIDGLHERSGSTPVYTVHGNPIKNWCMDCSKNYTFEEVCKIREKEMVPRCECGGVIRPAVVFFGEMLPEEEFSQATKLASVCDLMIVLGTSLVVTPAAYLPEYTLKHGGKIAIVNRDATHLDNRAKFVSRDLKEFADYINLGEFEKLLAVTR